MSQQGPVGQYHKSFRREANVNRAAERRKNTFDGYGMFPTL